MNDARGLDETGLPATVPTQRAPRIPDYCPVCLHVVSPRETTCHRCGHQYGLHTSDRVIGVLAWSIWMTAILTLAVLWW